MEKEVRLVDHLKFGEAAREWSGLLKGLTHWEDEHLLMDKPSPEKLQRHRKTVERLIFFGQLLALVASHPDFDDQDTADMIEATQHTLRDKLRMWHAPRMSQAESD